MNLQIRVVLPVDPVVSGASLPVRTIVRNVGTAAVSLPKPGTLSPVAFSVLTPENQVMAAGSAAGALAGTGVPPPGAPEQPVAPNQEITYTDDAAEYFGSPVAPGTYQFEAQISRPNGATGSTRIPLQVAPLAPDTVLRTVDRNASDLMTAVAHRRGPNAGTVYFSRIDGDGSSRSVLRPVLKLDELTGAPMLAIAPQVVTGTGIWVASLDAQGCRGTLVQPYDTAATFGPVKLRGGERLLETGIPLADGGAVFVAFGPNGGKPALTLIQVNARGTATTKYISLTSAPPTLPFLAIALENNTPYAYACWVNADSIMAAGFDPGSPPVEITPALLHRAAGRIAVHQPLPAAPGAPAQLDLIALAGKEEEPPSFTRLTLGSTERPGMAPLTPLPGTILARNISSWLMPISGGSASGPVVIFMGNAGWSLTDGIWAATGLRIPAGRGPQLIQFGNRLWVSAWSPQTGVSLEPVNP